MTLTGDKFVGVFSVTAQTNLPFKMKRFIVVALLLVSLASAQSVCQECETLIGYIDNWVENNNTIAEITQYLDQVCNANPNLALECEALVAYGIPVVVSWLKNNATPQQICGFLGVCSTPPPKQVQPIKKFYKLSAPKRIVKDDQYCSYCQLLVTTVEGYLENNATIAEIEQRLDQLCTFLPAGFNVYVSTQSG
jgi:hypothetical protein